MNTFRIIELLQEKVQAEEKIKEVNRKLLELGVSFTNGQTVKPPYHKNTKRTKKLEDLILEVLEDHPKGLRSHELKPLILGLGYQTRSLDFQRMINLNVFHLKQKGLVVRKDKLLYINQE